MSPPHILLFATQASGHLNAVCVIAEAAARNGYRATVAVAGDSDPGCSAARHRARVEEVGATFVDLDAGAVFDPRPIVQGTPAPSDVGTPTGPLPSIRRRVRECFRPYLAVTTAALADGPLPTVVVFDFFAAFGYFIAAALGVPAVAIFSGFPGTAAGLWPTKGLMQCPPDAVAEWSELLQALAAERQLRPQSVGPVEHPAVWVPGPVWATLPAGVPVVANTSPLLAPDSLPGVHLLGIPRLPKVAVSDSEALPLAALAEARRAGRPLVYISMGTMVLKSRLPTIGPYLSALYQATAAAAAAIGGVCVASCAGASPEALGLAPAAPHAPGAPLPPLLAVSFVPQAQLLECVGVDLYVAHGGANSFHEAVHAGVPLAVAPYFGDQAGVAAAVGPLGCGVFVPTPAYPALPPAAGGDGGDSEALRAAAAAAVQRAVGRRKELGARMADLSARVRDGDGGSAAVFFGLGVAAQAALRPDGK